jgi:hypothetical protein
MDKGFRYNCVCSTPKPSGEVVAVEIPSGVSQRLQSKYLYSPEPGVNIDALIETLSIALRNDN